MTDINRSGEDERERRRVSFDAAAEAYEGARPDYPEALFDDLVALAGVPADGFALEIGSGTGRATLPLARRGLHVLGIELGANMAAIARRNLAGYPNVQIEVGRFEEWPLPESAFDVAVSASAWHWIDPAVGYAKVARVLKPTGALAVFWASQHARPHAAGENGLPAEGRDDFDRALRAIVDHEAPTPARAAGGRSGRGHMVRAQEMAANGSFEKPVVRTYTWEETYDAAGYLRLLDSYSTYRVLEAEPRARVFAAIAELIERDFGGRIARTWRAELYVARKRFG